MKNNIVLIGMPGAGKSTVGVVLAKALGYGFVDTDILISRQIGMTLQDFINGQGINEFLKVEERAVLSLDCDDTVIATGGSVVVSECAMNRLKNDSTLVFLNIPLPELLRRLKNYKTRGITLRPGQTVEDVCRERQPLYEKYADMTVPDRLADGSDLEATVAEIVLRLGYRPAGR